MSTTTALNLLFPEYTDGQKVRHQDTLDVEQKVFSILDAYLQPSSAISTPTAAQEIDKLFPPASVDYTALLHLWDLVIVVTRRVDQGPPRPSDPATIAIANWDDEPTKLWADLPVLDHVLTDNVETHGIIINDDSDHQKRSRIRDINFQSFAARLTTAGVSDISRLAVYRIRNVLEVDPDFYIRGYDKVGPHLDTGIPVANVWISLASKLIFGFCKVNGEGASRNDMGGGKYWKGSAGFSVERWEFWKQRLDEIAVNDEASGETRDMAKKMKETMIAAED
ncbi:hypothetical protein BJ912DRAFT_1126544 [Pholiota molesta]|nr:hypothetical protein BJ912DRAFT_1126544 [Pholiota molesta]